MKFAPEIPLSLADALEVPTHLITAKITPDSDLRGVMDGDWDLARRYELKDAVKHQAMAQHFVEGMRWQDTELFRAIYAERLLRESVKRQTTLSGLAEFYARRVDTLYEDMRKHGYDRRAEPKPRVVIGRDGEIFLTNQGNHRVAIAKLLGIESIPCTVQCRHEQWLTRRMDCPTHPDCR